MPRETLGSKLRLFLYFQTRCEAPGLCFGGTQTRKLPDTPDARQKAARYFRRLGWRIVGGKAYCPQCVREKLAKTVPVPRRRPPLRVVPAE